MKLVNNFLLAGHKHMAECIWGNLDLHVVLVEHLQKTKKEFKNLQKQEIQNVFIKTNWIKFVFNKKWLMEILEN